MIRIKTPKGAAGLMCLVRPDTRFDPIGKYKVNIALYAADANELIDALKQEALNELRPKIARKVRMPGKVNEDGTTTFTFKSRSKPNVYDAGATLLAPEAVEALHIGRGTTIRVSGEAKAYESGPAAGVTLYLQELQIVHLVKGNDSAFEPDAEGSFVLRNAGRAASALALSSWK